MKNSFYFIFLAALITACADQPARIDTAVSQSFSAEWKYRAGTGGDARWEQRDLDDSAWTPVSGNQTLREQQQSTENGFGWYRKTIVLSDSLQAAIRAAEAAVIHLGKFAAAEVIYLNGEPVGKTGGFPDNYMGYHGEERRYLVPAHRFDLPGENRIAIRFHDGWTVGGFLDDTDLRIASATTRDKLSLTVAVSDSDYLFMRPCPIELRVALANGNRWPVSGSLIVDLTTDDRRPVRRDSLSLSIKPQQRIERTFTLDRPAPGFYRYSIAFVENGETACGKQLTVGYEPEEIVSPPDNQADLKDFWENSLAQLKKVAPHYKLTPLPGYSASDYRMYRVDMRSFGNERISGYYAQPKKAGKHPVIVEYMGYGSAPYLPSQTDDGFAHFILSIRGQGLNQPANRFGTWITYGLDDKANYYYRGAFCDVVRAIDFVCSRPEIDAERIAVSGGSQGGALSFVAAALDRRVKAAAPTIPFLSDYPDYFNIAPWPGSDFTQYLQQHPEARREDIYTLLSYFDIKNLAPWITCPLLMGIGVQDDVCPPHTNFAAYNQVQSEKRWMAFPEYGHSVGEEFYRESRIFFQKALGIE